MLNCASEAIKTKRCSKCKIVKPLSEFYKHPSSPDDIQYVCSQCNHEYNVSEKGRAYHHEYNMRPEMVEKNRARNSTPEARKYQRVYNQSEKHKESKRQHQITRGKYVSKILNATPRYKNRRKEYEKTPSGKLASAKKSHKRRIIKENVPATLTHMEWHEILKIQHNRCAICGIAFNDAIPPTRDHIIPVIMGGAFSKDNIQALCRKCNSSKSNTACVGIIRLGLLYD